MVYYFSGHPFVKIAIEDIFSQIVQNLPKSEIFPSKNDFYNFLKYTLLPPLGLVEGSYLIKPKLTRSFIYLLNVFRPMRASCIISKRLMVIKVCQSALLRKRIREIYRQPLKAFLPFVYKLHLSVELSY